MSPCRFRCGLFCSLRDFSLNELLDDMQVVHRGKLCLKSLLPTQLSMAERGKKGGRPRPLQLGAPLPHRSLPAISSNRH